MKNSFKPAYGLGNTHLQSIFSSMGPRKILEPLRAKAILKSSQEKIIETPRKIKLQAFESLHANKSSRLAILIHGWEGNSDSLYILATAQKLYDAGFDIIRLNMSDHGDTHHPNEQHFNSSLIDEVTDAIKIICSDQGYETKHLIGFSLGGNFTLRTANLTKQRDISLDSAIAICPAIDPKKTMDELNKGFFVYEKYFVKKWKSSLRKKLKHFPHFPYARELEQLNSLDAMNDYFIPRYTGYECLNSYFESYTLTGDRLKKIAIPTHIVAAADDPMIPEDHFNEINCNDDLTIEIQRRGGHCAFIKNWKFESWIPERILDILSSQIESYDART